MVGLALAATPGVEDEYGWAQGKARPQGPALQLNVGLALAAMPR